MKKTARLLSLVTLLCMLLTSCAQTILPVLGPAVGNANDASVLEQSHTPDVSGDAPEKGTYNEGVALVKYDGEMNDNVLSQLDLVSATALYSGSTWYTVELKADADTVETVTYLRELGCFEKVDYDYIMGATADLDSVDVSGNPAFGKQSDTFKTHHIQEAWDYLKKNGQNPGGSSDVVIAVIDTGVDYTHLDLRNNIWVNSAEIPDNGKDDDGNGYIDDLCGWNCVGDNKDPMDDNGHGTHVAGIIAAEDNKEGGVGVAYNCKIMVLKAGNSSGYFNNSDIAEAIQYAYMNGADVINMSFGGSNISIAVEEALENAYNTSILVAAAGNDSYCNQPGCNCPGIPMYPASLTYVIGVMSTDKDGKHLSSFSNYDHVPYNSYEYEVYAVGEGVYSTWPGNKYATLNGTSMATPMVSGIAALLRSYYSDREVYSPKFIQSQIVNTIEGDKLTVNLYNALTKAPKPDVNLYDYYIDDSTAINAKNNGNGVIDAGETVHLYIALHNRGGVASNVNVSIDTMRNDDPALTDPYFTFVNATMQLSDIGTYSVRESGDKYFEIIVDSECPNDYLVDFNIRFTYENGLDTEDKTVYEDDGKQKAQFNVSRGFYLPAIITEDTVYTADRLYIVGHDVVITEGVTVTFEEGCEIQFYDDREYYNSPLLINYGICNFNGKADRKISLRPNERHSNFGYGIQNYGIITVNYATLINCSLINEKQTSELYVFNSDLLTAPTGDDIFKYSDGKRSKAYSTSFSSDGNYGYRTAKYYNNYIHYNAYAWRIWADVLDNNNIILKSRGSAINAREITNNRIYTYVGSSATQTQICVEIGGIIRNNSFESSIDVKSLPNLINFGDTYGVEMSGNSYSSLYQQYAGQIIEGYYSPSGTPTVDVYGSLADASLLWPHIVSVEMFDKDGNPITTVGREEIKVRVTFNRPMDKNAGTFLTFGTIEPYGDYRIDGEYISDTVWEGTYTLKAQIENGQNFLKVNNAWAAEDQTKTVFGEYQLHEFTIDTTAAMSMNLQAVAKANGIELTFAQDDYDTLLGYNIYRADSKDGNYVKLNPAILLPSDSTFLDENAEPGKTYWYTYTVVLTDFTESNPAGKVQATAMDTLAPSLYHTPVNQGYMNNNLVITCTASDNVGIRSVMLYYRTVGATEWKTLSMVKQSDKFSAKIYGNDLTLDGIEYYIVAYDENNSIAKGSAEAPYTVVIKDSSAISRKGDVDGDGVVTTKDALMLMQCLNGDLILSDDEFRRADLNGDGVLNSSEALCILQYINGKLSTLEM